MNMDILLFLRIVLAGFLGAVIGLEREHFDKPAGLRTCILVSTSTASFAIIPYLLQAEGVIFDFGRIHAYIIASIGFLGAGVISKGKNSVEGVTTAAVLLSLVAIGLLCAVGKILLPIGFTLLVYGVLELKYINFKFKKRRIRKKLKKGVTKCQKNKI